jgi:bacterioferritin-associated ferredoxin
MDNNPLKQYFRRPSVYMKLPSNGQGYPKEALDMPETGELPVYPMTAIDEITARTPDALFNGTAIAELIKSCVPNIKDPWAVPNVDLDAILIAIKAASSSSGEMDLESTCPNCEEVSTYKINLAGILASITSPDFSQELTAGDLKVKLKSVSFKEINAASMKQFEFQRSAAQIDSIENEEDRNKLMKDSLQQITDLTMDLLCQAIEYIQTPTIKVDQKDFILDFLRHCDRNVYVNIRDRSSELRQISEVKPMKITCGSCEHKYEQSITLNPTDFFE